MSTETAPESPAPTAAPATPKPYRGGPRTAEGRARSRYNACRHGLTGRTVVLPSEDMEAYKKFSEEIVESLNPKTPFERQLAQTVADAQWRLNRARSWEDGMICAGAFGPPGEIDTEDPRIHAALAAAQVFQQESKAFANLTLYEQRLQRQQKQALDQLEKLRTERKTAEAEAIGQAKLIHKRNKMKGEPQEVTIEQFVFSTARLDAEIATERRWYEARLAQNLGYKRDIFDAKLAQMAA